MSLEAKDKFVLYTKQILSADCCVHNKDWKVA